MAVFCEYPYDYADLMCRNMWYLFLIAAILYIFSFEYIR